MHEIVFFVLILILELTEFPKIDGSDEEDETEKDERLTNSISSVSLDKLSLNNNTSGMSNIQQTSDYESFADCLRQSPMIANATATPLTNVTFDNRFPIRSSIRVNSEDLSQQQERRRKYVTSSTTTIQNSMFISITLSG